MKKSPLIFTVPLNRLDFLPIRYEQRPPVPKQCKPDCSCCLYSRLMNELGGEKNERK